MRGLAGYLVAAMVAVGSSGCALHGGANSPGGASSGFVADVGYRAVAVKVAVRRWKSERPLRVVVGPKVSDKFKIEPSTSMVNNYTEYRRTIGTTLQQAFKENFANVEVANEESGSGLELVVTRAEVQQSMTIKFGLSLLLDGKELLDVVGESEGKTVAMGGGYQALREKYDRVVEEVMDFTLASFAERAYDGIMRSKKLEAENAYDQLAKPQANTAPVDRQ